MISTSQCHLSSVRLLPTAAFMGLLITRFVGNCPCLGPVVSRDLPRRAASWCYSPAQNHPAPPQQTSPSGSEGSPQLPNRLPNADAPASFASTQDPQQTPAECALHLFASHAHSCLGLCFFLHPEFFLALQLLPTFGSAAKDSPLPQNFQTKSGPKIFLSPLFLLHVLCFPRAG